MKTQIEKTAIYFENEALNYAEEITPENGYIVNVMVDDPTSYSFREVDSWSGEISAFEVRDEEHNTVAIVAYWEEGSFDIENEITNYLANIRSSVIIINNLNTTRDNELKIEDILKECYEDFHNVEIDEDGANAQQEKTLQDITNKCIADIKRIVGYTSIELFKILSERSKKGYEVALSIGDYWMLKDSKGNIIEGDSACEDYYGTEDYAYSYFIARIISLEPHLKDEFEKIVGQRWL